MRAVNQCAEVLRRAVSGIGRKDQRAVIAPAALARKLVDRHQLKGGVAGVAEMLEPLHQPGEGAFRRHGADMHLAQDGLVPAVQRARMCRKAERAAHHAPAVRVVVLLARGGIGKLDAAGAEFVAGAGADAVGMTGPEAVVLLIEPLCLAAVDDKLD